MKQLIISILLISLTVNAGAQEMADLFVQMPDAKAVELEDAWRKDLVDLYKSGKEAKLKNMMQGTSQLMKLTADYLELQTSERSIVEMKRLPLVNNTYVICMITTVLAPVADSRVEFFTTEWKQLSAADIYQPVTAEWFMKPDADTLAIDYQNVMAALDMDLIRYRLSADEQTLTAEYTTPQYLDEELQKKAKAYLKDKPKVYTWKMGRFE